MKNELWEKHFKKLREEKKKSSGVLLTSKTARVMNLGEYVRYDRIDVIWKNGDAVEEWCLDNKKNAKPELPTDTIFFLSLKSGRLLAAELHERSEEKNEETEVYVCGYGEEDDDVVLLVLITMPGGYIFQYWNGRTHTPLIHFTGENYEDTLPNLYQEMRTFLVEERKTDETKERGDEVNGLSELWS